MENTPKKLPENVAGIYYVNDQCIDCLLCEDIAPANLKRNHDRAYFYVYKQPETPEEEALCKQVMWACPVDAIWNNGDGVDRSDGRVPVIPATTRLRSAADNNDDRIDCPFCRKMHYPGSAAAEQEEWSWDDDARCQHLMFLAVDISTYSGFAFRSQLFNRHFNLTRDDEIEIPSEGDPGESLSVCEIIEYLENEIPGLELRSYEDPGGIACGPVGGGTITFGFIQGDTK